MKKGINTVTKLSAGLLILLSGFFVGCQSSNNHSEETQQKADNQINDAIIDKATEASQLPKEVINPCPECNQTREFRGNFVYFADAAVLTECDSQMPLSVAVNSKMQLAYELHRTAPEAPLYFVAKGQIQLMPSMEEGLVQKQLVIDGDNWYFDAYTSCQ